MISKCYECVCLKCLDSIRKKIRKNFYINLSPERVIESPVKAPINLTSKQNFQLLSDSIEQSNDTNSIHNSEIQIIEINHEERAKNDLKEKFFNLKQKSELLISELNEKIENSESGFDLIYEEKEKDCKTKLWLKSFVNEHKHRINVLKTVWIAPANSHRFIMYQNNIIESRKLDEKNVEIYESFLNFGENDCYKLIYSKYKKILTASSRDFVYLKHFRKLSENKYIEVSKSLEDDIHPIIPENVRGEIIISGSIVEDLNSNDFEFKKESYKQECCQVTSYVEIDFKWSLPVFVVKPFTIMEIKKYIDICAERLNVWGKDLI